MEIKENPFSPDYSGRWTVSSQIVGEGWFLLHSFLFGIFLTWFYDLFRILRRVVPHGIFWVSAEDLIFWISASIGIFLLLYYENNGAFRWFAVFGAGGGMLFYKKTVSELWVRILSGLIGRVLKIIGKLLRILSAPLRAVGRKTGILWRRLFRRLRNGCRIRIRTINYRLTGWYKAFKIKLRKHEKNEPVDSVHHSFYD